MFRDWADTILHLPKFVPSFPSSLSLWVFFLSFALSFFLSATFTATSLTFFSNRFVYFLLCLSFPNSFSFFFLAVFLFFRFLCQSILSSSFCLAFFFSFIFPCQRFFLVELLHFFSFLSPSSLSLSPGAPPFPLWYFSRGKPQAGVVETSSINCPALL